MNINKIIAVFSILTIFTLFGCSEDTETTLQQRNIMLYTEDFSDVTNSQVFNTTNWTNFAEIGTRVWTEQRFPVDGGNGYAQFTSLGTGQLINVGWLISPAFNMDLQNGEKLTFQAAQRFLRSRENSLELLVSTDYDGINVVNADWINVPVVVPTPDTQFSNFVNSGVVDLSKYKGNLHFAFKVKGSGTTNSNLAGTYQIDNINIFYPSN